MAQFEQSCGNWTGAPASAEQKSTRPPLVHTYTTRFMLWAQKVIRPAIMIGNAIFPNAVVEDLAMSADAEPVNHWEIILDVDDVALYLKLWTSDTGGYALRSSDGQLYHWGDRTPDFMDKSQLADCIVRMNGDVTLINVVNGDDGQTAYTAASWVKWQPAC